MLSEDYIKALDLKLGNEPDPEDDFYTAFEYTDLVDFARTCYNLGVHNAIESLEDDRMEIEENAYANLWKLTR
jgi:hypothetical protein